MLRLVSLGSCLLLFGCNGLLDSLDAKFEKPTPVSRIPNPDPEYAAYFGAVMAFDGDSMFVSSSGATVDGVPGAGCGYLFEAEGNGFRTTRIQREVPSQDDGKMPVRLLPPESPLQFVPIVDFYPAMRVAMSKTLVVATWAAADAPPLVATAIDGASDAGAKAADASTGSGDASATPGGTGELVADVGTVCVYERDNGARARQCLFPEDRRDAMSWYGLSVALDEAKGVRRLVVGAPGAVSRDGESGPLVRGGATYVYIERDGRFELEQRIVAPFAADGDFFGGAVAIEGDTLAIGAPAEDSTERGSLPAPSGAPEIAAQGIGAVYMYRLRGDEWQLDRFLKPDVDAPKTGFFGFSLSLDGDSLAIGNPGVVLGCDQVTAPPSTALGAVYVATRENDVWSMDIEDCQSDEAVVPGGGLGLSVALSGDRLVAGAPVDSDGKTFGGAVYLKTRDAKGGWSGFKVLKAPKTYSPALYGVAAAIAGGRLAVGAARELETFEQPGPDGVGAVYLYSTVPEGVERKAPLP